jgi:L-threonylcarbamoyladenylate synthase
MAQIGKDIAKAAWLLKKGRLVGIPTETVYGLAGNAMNESAILEIFKAKNRPKFDPLIAHVASMEVARDIVEYIPTLLEQIMDAIWPGPLTVLLNKKPSVPELLTSGSPRVAVRMPQHPLALSLLEQLDFPLAAPSANPFGYVSPTSARHVDDQLGGKIEYILDGGQCQVGVESTIIGMEYDQLTVYRLGGIPIETLEAFGKVTVKLNQSSNPQAPGMLKSHYAPTIPLVIGDIPSLIQSSQRHELGVISFRKHYDHVKKCIQLSPTGSLDEAATRLFDALREMDQQGVTTIITEWFPEKGLGRAINDRLRRAATKR